MEAARDPSRFDTGQRRSSRSASHPRFWPFWLAGAALAVILTVSTWRFPEFPGGVAAAQAVPAIDLPGVAPILPALKEVGGGIPTLARVCTGAHQASDVLGGYLWGALAAAVLLRGADDMWVLKSEPCRR